MDRWSLATLLCASLPVLGSGLVGCKEELSRRRISLPPRPPTAVRAHGRARKSGAGSGRRTPRAGDPRSISGILTVGAEVKAVLPKARAVWLLARRKVRGRARPLTIAVRRLPVGPFPMRFSINRSHAMSMRGKSTPFRGPLFLVVRLDMDGNPMTSRGEPRGVSPGPVQPGERGVRIAIRAHNLPATGRRGGSHGRKPGFSPTGRPAARPGTDANGGPGNTGSGTPKGR